MTDLTTADRPGYALSGLNPPATVTIATPPAPTVRDQPADLDQVIDRYENPLLRYATQLMGQGSDDAHQNAQDVVQDAMLRLHTHWQKHGRASIDHLPTWLYRVTRNLATDALRRRLARRRFTLRLRRQAPSGTAPPSHDLEHDETLVATRRTLDAMPARPRELLLLRAEHNLTVRQIAEVLDMPHSTVAYQLNQALSDLAARLKEQGVI